MSNKMKRRDFLKTIAILTGVSAAGLAKLLSNPKLNGFSQQLLSDIYLPFINSGTLPPPSTATTEPSETPTPTPTLDPSATTLPPPSSSRVVHVRSEQAHNWDMSDFRYWNYVNQEVIDIMVDQGLITLTGTGSVAEAWASILPNYQPGEGVAIKVNFNNSDTCDDIGDQLDAIMEPVNAVIRGLLSAGIAEEDIWIYEPIRHMPNRFVDRCLYSNVKFYDCCCRSRKGFSSDDPSATVTFNPPSGIPLPNEILKISDVLIDAKYLINMPIMRGHGGAGVTLAFKHHYGSINGPMHLHIYGEGREYYTPDWSPMVDVYLNPNILGKTVLTIGDGIFGHPSSNLKLPIKWSTFGNDFPRSLFFAVDPVAIDSVMANFINAESTRSEATFDYLRLADEAGLGIYEPIDPWIDNYRYIDYIYITLS